MAKLNLMDWVAGTITTIGAISWGLVGFFKYDVLAELFDAGSGPYRVLTAIIGLAAVYVVGAVLVRSVDSESYAHA